MKKLIGVITSLILIITGAAYSKDYEIKKKIDNYTVEVTIDRNPPVVGDNNVWITIKDPAGKYVTDAKVKVEYSMPAMPGMPAINYKAKAELKDNKYNAKMTLSMSGSWNIAVKITRDKKTSKVTFSVDAQ